MLDIQGIMASLAEKRVLFHSEADFQHSLAWQIQTAMPESGVRLEVNVSSAERGRMFLDIWLPDEGVAIELKYTTRKIELRHCGELFSLRDHGAQDQKRYDFLWDIRRLELMSSNVEGCEAGYAVLLTNDPLYWRMAGRTNTVDAAFHLYEGRRVTGELNWSATASDGTKRKRESPIRLKGSYHLRWQDYSRLNVDRYGAFRYLAVSVA